MQPDHPEELLLSMSPTLLENLTTAVLAFDDGLRLQYMNIAAETLIEASDRQLHGLHIDELFREEPLATAHLQQVLTSDTSYTRRETRLQLPNGSSLTADYTVTPVRDNGCTTLLMELQPRDRQLRISREETIKTRQETAKTLVRGLAHEIKNPLGGIRGAAQLLARELPHEALKDYTNVIIEEADRLRNLVDRMLGPIRPPRMANVNIHEMLERVCSLIDAETGGNLRVVRNYDPSIPDIAADAEQLIQATLNIVRNAMQAISQHMPISDGRITLKTRIMRQFTIGNVRHRLVCRLRIIDNGPGIPAGMAESMFYPMISGRADGTGLGLSIAQSIITRHCGTITCDSEPGNTVFSLLIPFEQPDRQAHAGAAP